MPGSKAQRNRRRRAGYAGPLFLAALWMLVLPADWATGQPGAVVMQEKARLNRLAFAPGVSGEYTFDTGLLRGKLRQGGKSLGLSGVVHAASGARVDRGVGILSTYRVFTTDKRHWTAGWNCASTARLLSDGAVAVTWPAAEARPFELSTRYRWNDAQTLDVETTVKAEKDLKNFEVFLASYFHESLRSPFVYVRENPEASGKPGFLAARKSFGDWQMFPRDEDVVEIIRDGRWTKEPHPVDWAIMPHLAAPVCVRRGGATDVTVILMAPPEDCFAIATPYEGEGHYSLYLSLFGRDIKAGRTSTAHSRLVVTKGASDAQVLALYKQYMNQRATSGR